MLRSLRCMPRSLAVAILVLLVRESADAVPFCEFSPSGDAVVATWPAQASNADSAAIIALETGRVEPLGGGASVAGASWSPDGQFLVYSVLSGQAVQTRLRNLRTGRERTLRVPIGPPFAWREDGKRFAGIARADDGQLQVVFFNTTEFGETLRVDLEVQRVEARGLVWLYGTDDVMLLGGRGSKTDVYAVESGQVRQISSTGDVIAMARGCNTHSVVWTRSSRNLRYILLSLYEFDTNTRSVRRLGFPERVSLINPTPQSAPVALDTVLVSPSSNRLVVVASYAAKGGGEVLRLFSIPLTGNGASQVRAAHRMGSQAPWPRFVPALSPDGRHLCVLHQDAAECVLALFDPNGKNGRIVVRSPYGGRS